MLFPVAAKAFTLVGLTVCPVMKAPTVDVTLGGKEPTYILDLSSKAIGEKLHNNQDSTFALDSRWMTGGVTVSNLKDMSSHIEYSILDDQAGSQCVYISKITYRILYAPEIYIASDYLNSQCHYGVIKAHEEQHVAIEVQTLTEYVPFIKMQLLKYLRTLGYSGFGPYSVADAEKQREALSHNLAVASAPIFGALSEALRERQAEIDTVENYKRESARCPGEFPEIKDAE